MIAFILVFGILSLFFSAAYMITGALFKALVWLCVSVPVALLLWGIGLLCCCTLILIPIGMKMFIAGCRLLVA